MTELTFLVDLLLNHRLPKATRDAVAIRIKEVEEKFVQPTPQRVSSVPLTAIPPHLVGQSPSTIAAMLRHEQQQISPPQLEEQAVIDAQAMKPVPTAPAVIAQTPATVAALNARQQLINQAVSGKPIKGETSPRKF